MTSSPRTVLITGASSGLGAEFAVQFARRGSDLVLVARREERLRELADRLSRDHGVRAEVIALDLGQAGAATRLRERLDAADLRIDGLINNAGFGMHGPLADADPERLDAMVQLNVAALTNLTREFLPDILAADGILVSIASMVAYQPCPTMAAYGATKTYVLSLTEAIAYEARATNARVLAVSPGPTRTEFFDTVGGDMAVGAFQTADQVVARALRALDATSHPASVVSGWRNAVAAAIVGILPRRVALAVAGRVMG
ncbi:SDR family oxidoreductase [Microbacterium sp. G2-8]|uniref:SDR family NAD(P)-dependent oxidoreductase n=1 Tax=Microbacterium sp. G2-8 TaxID=2842454 RepID=UPI001C892562|nr:SDR family oxidoreductase [Microbacterium sp. G2-8]